MAVVDPTKALLASVQVMTSLVGTESDDRLTGGISADHIEGRGGNDRLDGSSGNDYLYGDYLTQPAQPNPGNDTLDGDAGNDTLDGGGGDDDLQGGRGADRLIGGLGNNSLDGGGDTGDIADYGWTTGGVIADLLQGYASGEGFADLLIGILGLTGGNGNDTLLGSDEANRLAGGLGDDLLLGNGANDYLTGGSGVDSLDGGSGNDTLAGGALGDSLLGGIGIDRLIGGAGNNTLDGGGDSPYDTADYRWTGSATSSAGIFVDLGGGRATGSGFSDIITGIRSTDGGAGNDTLNGNASINALRGMGGADLLTGQAGNDALFGDDNTANASDGNDTVLGGDGADRLWGGGGDDLLQGDTGNDTLQGGTGNNVLAGGGNPGDTVDYRWADSEIVASLVGGIATGTGFADQLSGLSSVIGGDFSDSLTGDSLANSLYGGAGNDTLQGLAGNDYLAGEAGDDRLDGGAGNDTLAGGAGNDLLLGGAGKDELEGGSGENTLIGGAGDKAIYESDQAGVLVDLGTGIASGTGFLDTLVGITEVEGGIGNDTLQGGSGDDDLDGGDGDDTLDGGTGDDTLTGGTGFNVLDGGEGFDTLDYSHIDSGVFVSFVENLVQGAGIQDQISGFEAVELGKGNDTVVGGGVSYRGSLGGVTCDLGKQGSQDTGSSGLDTLLDVISLEGSSFSDVLSGNAGDNIIDGLGGSDTMAGGAGNDYYYVDSERDEVDESAIIGALYVTTRSPGIDPAQTPGSGIDTVESTVSYLLKTGIENLILALGSAALTGAGNELSNLITGNELKNTLVGFAGSDTLIGGLGNDTLSGGAGDDSMVGGIGNDLYVVDSTVEANVANHMLIELPGEGTDTVQSARTLALPASFENLTLTGSTNINGSGNIAVNVITGNTGANVVKGLAGNDTLDGGAGADTLSGGLGTDRLTGGADADSFLFDTALNAAGNIDTILDLASGTDKILLDDDIFTRFSSAVATTVQIGQFIAGPGLSIARDGDDFLIYNTTTGDLYYDSDGNGAATAVKFAVLSGAPSIALTDFLIIN